MFMYAPSMAIKKVLSPTRPWEFDWSPAPGKRKRKRFATKREAEAFQAKTMQAVRSGVYVDPKLSTKMTVDDLYKDWMERVSTVGARGRQPIAVSTRQNYERVYLNHVRPRWGKTPLSMIHHDDVATWVATMTRNGEPVGENTRRRVALVFGRILGHAVKMRVLATNPAKDAGGGADYVPMAPVQRKHVYLTGKQLSELAYAADPHTDLVLVMGTCGLRWSEAAALRPRHLFLDGDEPFARISEAWSGEGKERHISTTKSRKDRKVPIPVKVAERLRVRTLGMSPDALVFPSRSGGEIHRGHFGTRVLGDASAAVGLNRVTPHDFRHTAVSLAIAGGASVKVVQRIAGHASATMTLDVYADLFEDDLFESARSVNAMLPDLDMNNSGHPDPLHASAGAAVSPASQA